MERVNKSIMNLLLVMMGVLFFLGAWQNVRAAETTGGIQAVRTIQWAAKTKKKVNAVDINTGETVLLNKNTPVVVTNRNYFRSKQARSLCNVGGHFLRIPNSLLKYKADLCTGEAGDYSDASKEYFVNVTRNCTSATDRLIWVCLDKQRVNVFIGSPGNWKLEQTFLTSTGKAETPTKTASDVVNFKKMDYKIEGSRVKYFVEAIGSGFHKWNLSGRFRRRIGKHTISHGCIRLVEQDAKWMFENIKPNTRVVIY